jgi:hypothetical protein
VAPKFNSNFLAEQIELFRDVFPFECMFQNPDRNRRCLYDFFHRQRRVDPELLAHGILLLNYSRHGCS